MPSPAAAFKTGQEAALRSSAALAAAMGQTAEQAQLFTEVPGNAVLPYVVLGQDEIDIDASGCAVEAEVTSTVSWWSRARPPDKGAQARAMGAAIIDALLLQLDLDGWTVDEWEMEPERYVTDPDQSTHGVVVFHYLLTQVTA